MMIATWIGGALLCLAGLLLYGFNTSNPNALRFLMLAGCDACAILIWLRLGCPLSRDRFVLAVLAVASYAALSLIWSADWRQGVLSLNELLLLTVLLLTLLHVERERLLKGASAFAIAGVAITTFISGYDPQIWGGLGNENFQSEFLVAIAPLALMAVVAWQRPTFWVLGFAAGSAAIVHAVFINPSDAKWAGLAGVAALGLLALLKWRQFWFAAGAAVLAIGVSIPVLHSRRIVTSIFERFELAYNTLAMWWHNPLLGVGIGGFNHQYPFFQEAHRQFFDTKVIRSVHNYAGAAHNEFAQALAVFGLVGLSLFCIALWFGFQRLANDTPARFGLASLFAFAGLSLVGFPTQNASTAILGIIALSTVIRITHGSQTAAEPDRGRLYRGGVGAQRHGARC